MTSNYHAPQGPPATAAGAVDVVKIYGSGDAAVRALDTVTVGFESQRFSAIRGPFGSGKSTLLHCVAGLDDVTTGRIRLGDIDITDMSDGQRTLLRRDKIGFVFQSFNLLPTFSES